MRERQREREEGRLRDRKIDKREWREKREKRERENKGIGSKQQYLSFSQG